MALVGRVARVMRSVHKRVLALLKCALQHTLAGAIDTRRKKHRALSKKARGAELCYGVMSFIGRRCASLLSVFGCGVAREMRAIQHMSVTVTALWLALLNKMLKMLIFSCSIIE
jgi:hypothetical protein